MIMIKQLFAGRFHDGGFTDPTEDGEPASPYWYNWMANMETYVVDPEWQFAGNSYFKLRANF